MRYFYLLSGFAILGCSSDLTSDTGPSIDSESFEMRLDPLREILKETPTDFELVSEDRKSVV